MDDEAYQEKRQSFLVLFYLMATCAVFFVLLLAVTVPFILGMVLVTAGLCGSIMLHWWLWGQSASRATLTRQDEDRVPPVEAAPADDDPYRGRY